MLNLTSARAMTHGENPIADPLSHEGVRGGCCETSRSVDVKPGRGLDMLGASCWAFVVSARGFWALGEASGRICTAGGDLSQLPRLAPLSGGVGLAGLRGGRWLRVCWFLAGVPPGADMQACLGCGPC